MAPDYLFITDCLKATPFEEGGQRFVHMEASNESIDHQQEVVLADALKQSADYFLQYGNLDIDHITQIGAKQGIPDYALFEIGQPVDVKVRGRKTFVKGRIYSGDGQAAEKANQFWESLTELNPPARWYPSVGGQVTERGEAMDPKTGMAHKVVKAVRWTNIGFSHTPVNITIPTVSTVPLGVMAKSWGAYGLDMTKAEGLADIQLIKSASAGRIHMQHHAAQLMKALDSAERYCEQGEITPHELVRFELLVNRALQETRV